MLRPTDSPHVSSTSTPDRTFSSLPDTDEKETTPKQSESSSFKNIQIVNVDTSSASIESWPPQIENITLGEIHKDFENSCNTKYKPLISKLSTVTIWMINSTAVGGGVAEMFPAFIAMCKEVNVTIKWVVISPRKNSQYEQAFFNLTKQIHNNIHGVFNMKTMEILKQSHRNILEAVCKECCNEFIPLVKPNDIIIIHDPQPLAMIKFIKKSLSNLVFWRSHIGVDDENEVTNTTWNFLKPYISLADHVVYSLKDYVPKYILEEKKIPYDIIPPAICPFTPKNIGLSHAELLHILSCANIIHSPSTEGQWQYKVTRVCGKTGKLVPCSDGTNTNYDLLFSPLCLEVSRWDKLKGWIQLIEAFVHLKQNQTKFAQESTDDIKHRQYINNMILVLAGPDPKFIQDDPEGIKVFKELCTYYQSLSDKFKDIQEKIYILSLPMANTEQNAITVNALQRLSSMVIQNSLREGFGLTVTEAMYKGAPMVAANVGGIKSQVEDGINGINIQNPSDYQSVAKAINTMIASGDLQRKKYAIAGKQTVINKFLIWSQCRNYFDMLNYHISGK